jgi:signal transduction histidine kinase
MPDTESREAVDSLGDVVHLAIARLRQLLFELRPPALERGGLADTIQRLEQEMGEAGVELHVEDRMAAEPSGDTSVNAYRIVQEALANVRKHARAGRATVVLETKGRSLHVRIEDDGVGATPERFTDHELGHMGIAAMRERAELAGGWCTIEGVPGRGTTVECILPTDVTARTAIAHVNRRDASRATSAAGPGSL